VEERYKQTLDYLFAQLPMYQRVGAAAYKEGLEGILNLCEKLGNPHKDLRFVHLAGTNGKGSTSHFLASVFQEAGFKTGLYTSPHLVDFRERIKINGLPVSKDFVIEFTDSHRALFEELHPSFFEMTVAMAFEWFRINRTDIVILETGMGGRLDSTNIVTPLLSVITNIGFDHMKFLGDTLPKIASEKAGIIKPGVTAVIGETVPGTRPVFTQKALECNSPVVFCEDLYTCTQVKGPDFLLTAGTEKIPLTSSLRGSYQEKNIRTAFGAFAELQKIYPRLQLSHFREGVKNVLRNTGLRGRWEQLASSPALICDIGHNEHGFREILKSISEFPHGELYMVLGFVNDKDLSPIFGMLPKEAHYVFTQSTNPRSLSAEELALRASEFGFRGETVSEVKKAVNHALQCAKPEDLVFLGGSTFTVADFLS
jgi:dihydrofolate synthase/folylpolyglutamate synthase